MDEDFGEVKLGGGVILGKVVVVHGLVEMLFEDFVFGYVFGDFGRKLFQTGFGGNAPGDRGVVTEVVDIKLGGVVVNSRFVNTGGVNRGRNRGENSGKRGEG